MALVMPKHKVLVAAKPFSRTTPEAVDRTSWCWCDTRTVEFARFMCEYLNSKVIKPRSSSQAQLQREGSLWSWKGLYRGIDNPSRPLLFLVQSNTRFDNFDSKEWSNRSNRHGSFHQFNAFPGQRSPASIRMGFGWEALSQQPIRDLNSIYRTCIVHT